ncbi:MFS transporter [Actinomadura parmotrematis]|uniref:MFS transporter n=1 Tax=Actinomadura parmotrematis TaxID=2864039 RepID=UPI0027E2B8D3|nr:MFS transporter [Actinomadura parmotrematis]
MATIAEGAGAPSVPRRMWMWASVHAADDFYQGLVPASIPYLVLERHYGYVAASGLTLAATLGGALPQPLVGVAVDRLRLPRLAAAGVLLAGLGFAAAGLGGPYAVVWTLLLLSGLGTAMFHPAAGKAARDAAGGSVTGMSVFAAGGTVGFFLAPVLAVPVLGAWGARGTAAFLPPAVLAAFVLVRDARGRGGAAPAAAPGRDRWRPFAVLTGISVVRSAMFSAIATFIGLYWIRHLGGSAVLAGAALACFLGGGVLGTIAGGRIADRAGPVRAVRIGAALAVPVLAGLRLAPGPLLPLPFAVLAGAAVNVPFAVLVRLGQDYLPGRPGTAAGVTLGLGVSAGGLLAPAFGLAAEARGTPLVFTLLCFVPLAALALALLLPPPDRG